MNRFLEEDIPPIQFQRTLPSAVDSRLLVVTQIDMEQSMTRFEGSRFIQLYFSLEEMKSLRTLLNQKISEMELGL